MKKFAILFAPLLMTPLMTLFFSGCTELPIKTVEHQESGKDEPDDTKKNAEAHTDPAVLNKASVKLTQAELEKYAYEIGLDPKKNSATKKKSKLKNGKNFAFLSAHWIHKKSVYSIQKFCRGLNQMMKN